MYKQLFKRFIIIPIVIVMLFLLSIFPLLAEALRNLILHLPTYLYFFLDVLYSALLFVIHCLLYLLQLSLSFIYKIIHTFPWTRDALEFLRDTPLGRMVRQLFSLFFNKTHRLEAHYAWHNLHQKLTKKKGDI